MEKPILLIEDNQLDIDLTRRAFEKSNLLHPLQFARDGEEALAYIQQWEAGAETPVLILLDLKIPKINGLDVLTRLKSHPQFKRIPVIVLTTSDEEKDIQAAYERGTNAYIVKPVNFDKFTQIIAQIQQFWCETNTSPT
jgi:CheY-like chemotaxis protein